MYRQSRHLKRWAEGSPRRLKPVLRKIKETWNIEVSLNTLKRVLKALRMSWRRLRRVPAKRLPSAEYERKRSALEVLKRSDAAGVAGVVKLYCLYETGFTLEPPIPYCLAIGRRDPGAAQLEKQALI